MKRKCYWCNKIYDTKHESSIWCAQNPHRGKGANRIKKSIVKIMSLVR